MSICAGVHHPYGSDSNLIDEDMLFHFTDELQNCSRMESQRRQLSTIHEAIMQAQVLTDFNHENAGRARGEEKRGNHNHGGGDCGKVKEQWPNHKKRDTCKSDG